MEPITRYALGLVAAERQYQDERWGDQASVPLFERLSILVEEVGELAEAINETHSRAGIAHPERGGLEAIKREAVQVAAVATAIVEAVTRRQAAASDMSPEAWADATEMLGGEPDGMIVCAAPEKGAD